jgi:hypothetical protein
MISDEGYAQALCHYLLCCCSQDYTVSRLTSCSGVEGWLTRQLAQFRPDILLYDEESSALVQDALKEGEFSKETLTALELTTIRQEAEAEGKLYQYLSMPQMLQQIRTRKNRCRPDEACALPPKSEIVGVYSFLGSPDTQQRAEALAQEWGKEKSVLLLLAAEYADYAQVEGECAEGMSELIYYMQQQIGMPEDFLGRIIVNRGKYDTIAPLGNPEDIHQIAQEDWEQFFSQLQKNTRYDRILFVCGTAIKGMAAILSGCDRIQIWSRPGEDAQRYVQSLYTYAQMEGYPQLADRAGREEAYE